MKKTKFGMFIGAFLTSVLAFGETFTDGNGIVWTYTVTNGCASIGGGALDATAIPKATSGAVVVPETMNGHTVAYVAPYAFYSCKSLTCVSLPNGIVEIGQQAFAYCDNLEAVNIPHGVATIGAWVFYCCYALRSIELPDTVVRVGNNSFGRCDSLASARISMADIPERIFSSCGSLSSVEIAEGATNISGMAFWNCSALTNVTIPASVRRIQYRAFDDCTSLALVTFTGDRESIDMDICSAFCHTPYLESLDFSLVMGQYSNVVGFTGTCPPSVVIPPGVQTIQAGAFSSEDFPSVTNLVSITLSGSVGFIGADAFRGCASLSSMNVPANIYNIEQGAFDGCSVLANVEFEAADDEERQYRIDRFAKSFRGTPFFDALPFKLLSEMRSFDGGITRQAFISGYVGRCPDELDIAAVFNGQWTRERQSELERSGYDIGDAPQIGGVAQAAFVQSGVKSVILPASLTIVEGYAFGDCTNLTRIVFKDNAPEIGTDAFLHVNPSCAVYVPVGSTGWGVAIPGEWMGMQIRYAATGVVEDGILVSVNLGGETEYTIPAGVTNVAANAFSGCGDLERVVISDGVTNIDRSAFDGCGKLWANWYKAMANGSAEAASTTIPTELSLTVTNVVVHYVTASVQSAAVTPPETTGLVTVIAEVTSGRPVAIASTWAEQYPGFETKFGSDFTAALTKLTGKRDGAGNAMLVWQDFVAGTDPTDPDDNFTASITFDAQGRPVISWSPELSSAEAAKRTYRKFGKVRLNDANWTEIAVGEEEDYNFFKVTVEMK